MCDLGFPSVVNYRQILTIVIIVTHIMESDYLINRNIA